MNQKNIRTSREKKTGPPILLFFMIGILIWFLKDSDLFWGSIYAVYRNPLQMFWNIILLLLMLKSFIKIILLTGWHFIFSDTQKIGQKLEWYQDKYKHLSPETKKLFWLRGGMLIIISFLYYALRFLSFDWSQKYSLSFSEIVSIHSSTSYLKSTFSELPWLALEPIGLFMTIIYLISLFEGRSRIIARLLGHFFKQTEKRQWVKDMPPRPYDPNDKEFHLCLFSYFTDSENEPVLHETQYEKWCRMGSKSLFTNCLIVGPTGGGKTTTSTYPALYQSIMWQALNKDKKVTMLVSDPKGDLGEHVQNIVKLAKRENDILVLKIGGKLTINPIEVDDIWSGQAAWRVASWIISAWKNFQGGGNKDPYWESQSYDLVKHLLVMSYYLKGKKTSIYDIANYFNECSVGCFEKPEGKMSSGIKKLNDFGLKIIKILLNQTKEDKQKILLKYELPETYILENDLETKWEEEHERINQTDPVYQELIFVLENSPTEKGKQEVKKQLENYRKKNKQTKLDETKINKLKNDFVIQYFLENDVEGCIPKDSSDEDPNHVREIVLNSCKWLLDSWSNQAIENMGNVLSTIRPFLQQFSTPEIRDILCPENPNVNFDTSINEGIIILPQFPINDIGEKLSSAVNTLIKSRWQHAVLQNGMKSERPKILLMDEAQKVINFGDNTSGGDFEYMEVSRSFGGISILLTQSLSALEAKASNPNQYKKIHGVIRSLIIMGTSDDKTIDYIVKVLGKQVKKRISRTVSESASSPHLDLISEKFKGNNDSLSITYTESESLEDRLTSKNILETPFSVATALIFDGQKINPYRCALRPYYWQNETRKWSFMENNKFNPNA